MKKTDPIQGHPINYKSLIRHLVSRPRIYSETITGVVGFDVSILNYCNCTMIAVSFMLFALIQCSLSCRSTTDCTETDVIPTDSVVKPPSLTVEQARILNNLYRELMQLPCDERRDRVYNTTVPPINLTNIQGLALLKLYHEYFKEMSHNNKTGSCFFGKRAAANINVCSLEVVNVTLNLALDGNGVPVYIPQIPDAKPPVYKFKQTFQEYKCVSVECAPGLSCQCLEKLGHNDLAVVSYLDVPAGESAFYVKKILLNDCSAYIM
ncbi:uncharacterized protein [Antedon mediterranea]|uniref:uncharacterized protein n=1 Tax=Antedon mediterranea TaxID=105859 RepID=UPI003AF6E6F9